MKTVRHGQGCLDIELLLPAAKNEIESDEPINAKYIFSFLGNYSYLYK